MTFLPSILARISSLGLNGKALSKTKLLGKLMLCLDPTLYILTRASLTMYVPKYVPLYIKIYIHTIVYTIVCHLTDNKQIGKV